MKHEERSPIFESPANRSLNDKAYDLFGELLLEQETHRMLQEIEDEKAGGETTEMDAFFAAHDRANLQRIQQYFRKQRLKAFMTKTVPKAIQVASIFIASIFVAGSIALATNETVRVEVMRLISTMSEEYTSLKLVEDEEASFDVPSDWQGNNYPSYLPADLQMFSMHSYVGYCSVSYKSAGKDAVELDFSELGSDTETNIDTENATICTIMIRDYPGFLAVKEERISLYWSDGQDYFILLARNIDKDSLIKVAESVRRVR